MRTRLIATVCGLPVVAGCTVGPDYQAPAITTPAGFGAPETTKKDPAASSARPPAELATWWKSLNDPELNSLLDRALRDNLDLQIAAARFMQARAQVAVVTGSSLPSLDASAGLARGSGNNSTKSRVAGPLDAGSNTAGLTEITTLVGFDASWEIDLFGRLRRELEAAMADAQAAAALREQVLVSLLADVVRGYADVRSLQSRLAIARRMIVVSQQTLDLIRVKYERGMVNELDLALAQREVGTLRSRIAPLEAELASAERGVAVLLGQYPEELRSELDPEAALPEPPPEVSAGVPAELLRRRPDIREAESELVASNARIGAALAEKFPRVSITGAFGYQNQGLGRTPVQWSPAWSVGPAVRWQVFDFGTIDALVAEQDYRTRELLVNYRKLVILAVEEVDNALSNYSAERSRLAELDDAAVAARRAVDLATRRYDRGLTDFLNVLDAQRQLYDLEDQQAVSHNQAVREFAAVCKALGGGWEGCALADPEKLPGLQDASVAAGAAKPAAAPSR